MSKFIVIEGLEGAGKSTALEQVSAFLTSNGIPFITTREPGGTPLAEKMRAIVKEVHEEALTPEAELLLMYASRVQLIENVIKPALAKGQWVIGDRHDWSSIAYQGGGRQLPDELLMPIRSAVLKGFSADWTILMDVAPEIGLARARQRGELDRIEQEQLDFFVRTREKFIELASATENCSVINANASLPEVKQQLDIALQTLFEKLTGN